MSYTAARIASRIAKVPLVPFNPPNHPLIDSTRAPNPNLRRRCRPRGFPRRCSYNSPAAPNTPSRSSRLLSATSSPTRLALPVDCEPSVAPSYPSWARPPSRVRTPRQRLQQSLQHKVVNNGDALQPRRTEQEGQTSFPAVFEAVTFFSAYDEQVLRPELFCYGNGSGRVERRFFAGRYRWLFT